MTKADRLKLAREAAGFMKAAEAADRYGWRRPTYFGHENGSRGFSSETAAEYARAFRVTPEWLLYGRGDTPDDLPVTFPDQSGNETTEMIPVYDVAASAGDGAVVEYEPIIDQLSFPSEYLRKITKSSPSNLAIISVKGDSMLPTLHDDDVVMLDISKTNLDYDGMFVIRSGEALLVKRVMRSRQPNMITIRSDNHDLYPPYDVVRDEVAVIGKVLWFGRKV